MLMYHSTKNKVKLEYINEEQPLFLELTFDVELGLNSHSKNLRCIRVYSRLIKRVIHHFYLRIPTSAEHGKMY